MDATTKGALIEQGGKLLAEGIRLLASRPAARKADSVPVASESVTRVVPKQISGMPLPTKEQTILELKRRLHHQIRQAEGDLSVGLVYANRICDCLEAKHTWEIEALASEVIPEDPGNTVYSDIIQWIRENQEKVTRQAVASGKYKQEYPRMAAEFRDFRKRLMATISPDGGIAAPIATVEMGKTKKTLGEVSDEPRTLGEAKKIATDEVERIWHLAEKK